MDGSHGGREGALFSLRVLGTDWLTLITDKTRMEIVFFSVDGSLIFGVPIVSVVCLNKHATIWKVAV